VNTPLLSTIAISFALFVGCLAASVWKLGTLDPSILHLQLTFSEAGFNAVLAQWGPAEVARFKSHFVWDYAALTSYAVFGIAASRWVVERTRVTGIVKLLLPWLLGLAAITDLLENLLHQLFVSAQAGQVAPMLFALAGACASTKFLLLLSWPVLTAVSLLRRSTPVTTRPTTS
jgi:hypothetical protein